MVDLKQLQYFAACARTGSISKAAEVLYTTQSSVSKVIKAMETSMNVTLFERYAKGIRLTREGEHVYKYACPILDHLEKLQAFDRQEEKEVLLVSCNPSSWFADMFVQFYQKNQKESIHYQVYSASSREIVDRVRERSDDVGFVYVMKNQLPAFQYFLARNYLEFTALKTTDITLYPGAGHPYWQEEGRQMTLSGLKLIQRFPDEFSPDNYWDISDENGDTAADAETVITTNSDYIMERILHVSDLVNISGGYLAEEPWRKVTGEVPLSGNENQVLFGYVKRQNEPLSAWAGKFVDFLKEKLGI
ncbi:MAG: LysR family transcriptional regulator [Eubacteriales bacterium]|nr:LysR family transcriptional regulator [Eubacteriales bacterium]